MNLEDKSFKTKKKWSDRVKITFKKHGKFFDKNEEKIKQIVGEEVDRTNIDSLKKSCKTVIKTFVSEIERHI